MSKKIFAALVALACACAANPAAAQEAKSLYWRALDVTGHLDADGRLRIRERQTMVFNGDWNGGERTFNMRAGQQLQLYGISRIDPTGAAHPLAAGDLDEVDHFDWVDSKTLRWRSRMPSDPPFVNQEIVYQIDYQLSNILIPTSDGYQLDHDFAFPDRAGVIERFSLSFDEDRMWQSPTPLPVRLERQNLQPGASVVVKIPLRYAGTGTPAGVQRGAPTSLRLLLAFILLGGFVWLLRGFFASEGARGRFAPLTPANAIDATWLREHVFSIPPEVVGAAWDTTTGAPEVAAMIARMVQEGKLTSRVEPHKRKQILHLELMVARSELTAEERKLIDALFEAGETQTDTEQIKQRYRKSGFDPAAIIRKGIEQQVKALVPNDRKARGATVMRNIAIILTIVAAAAAALVLAKGSALVLAPIIALATGVVALVLAAVYRGSVVDMKPKALRFVLFLVMATVPAFAVVLGLFEAGAPVGIAPMLVALRPGLPLLVALVGLSLAITLLVLRAARTREAPARLELRRTLAAARVYFARELQQQQPALQDEWFPYLMAFGLGAHIDKWFRAFGPATHAPAVVATSSAFAYASSSGGWTGGGPLFGGGGGFGGSGTGRSWASAAETFSSGVASPSSSSSGGGGGGGGSSGGGGGGGW